MNATTALASATTMDSGTDACARNWVAVIAKAAALGVITDDEQTDAADPHADMP